MLFRNCLFISLLLFSSTIKTNDNQTQNIAQATVTTLAVVGGTYLVSKAWAHCVVLEAQSQFAPERALLNHYAYYNGNYWTSDAEAALKRDLKVRIVHLHNSNRDRWGISVLYDIYNGNPAVYVENRYQTFPLLQHMQDLNWYIKRLKIIRFLRLHSDRNELTLLIDQLEYIKNILMADHDYNLEEQHFH